MATTADFAKLAGALPEVVSQVLAGNEVLLTQANKPVARIVPVLSTGVAAKPLPELKVRSLARPRVLTPRISGAEIAEEMFDRE